MASALLLWEHTWWELSAVKGPKRKEKEKNLNCNKITVTFKLLESKYARNSTFLTLEYFHKSDFP